MSRVSVFTSMILIFLLAMIPQVLAGNKTFSGRVIDSDTKEPIEGAVVVAYWYSERPGPIGDDTKLEDVKETLTDKDGRWSIVGKKGRDRPPLLSAILFGLTGFRYTKEPGFIIFKPGYCSWPKGFSMDACKDRIRVEGSERFGEGKTLALPKLTNREDRLAAQRISEIYPSSTDPKVIKKFLKKQLELLRLLDEERRNLGLSESKIYEELKNEK